MTIFKTSKENDAKKIYIKPNGQIFQIIKYRKVKT